VYNKKIDKDAVNNTIDWGKGKTNNTIGWGTIYSSSPYGDTDLIGTPAGDADANAFISAAAITDATQKSAIDKLVVDLKGYGIWSKMKAIYPFIGGSAAQHKFNLRNPIDSDSAFRLVFNGGWVHSSTGSTPNGVNGYANTYFIAKNNFTSNINRHLSIYLRTNNIQIGDRVDIGSIDNESGTPGLGSDYLSANNGGNVGGQLSSTNILFPMSDRRGLSLISKASVNQSVFKNGVLKATTSGTGNSTSDFPIFLGGTNLPGFFPYGATNNEFGFSSIGDGLTDTEAANYYTAIQAFQTTLSRNV